MTEEQSTEAQAVLTDITVDTVGLVGKAANKRKFVLFKSADQQEEPSMGDETEGTAPTEEEQVQTPAEETEAEKGPSFEERVRAAVSGMFAGLFRTASEPAPEPAVKDDKTEELAELRKAVEDTKAALEEAQDLPLPVPSDELREGEGVALLGALEGAGHLRPHEDDEAGTDAELAADLLGQQLGQLVEGGEDEAVLEAHLGEHADVLLDHPV